MMTGPVTAKVIAELLSRYRLRCGTEDELHNAIQRVFFAEQVGFVSEVKLGPHDRIDFMVGRVGIECKVGGGLSDLTRQLWRYAEHEDLDELLVVTTRQAHLSAPTRLYGKPVLVHALLAGIG